MRGIVDLGKNIAPKPVVKEIGVSSTIGGKKPKPVERATGASKSAMLGVALLSAAVAGGSAYFFARNSGVPVPSPAPAAATVAASVQIVPPDARVVTRDGVLPVVAGVASLRGQAGETLNVTVQRGTSSKTFAVSLGSDGIATPGRLVLE
jgi:hypothetical protein